MKLTRVVEQVYARPWAITPAGFAAVDALIRGKLDGSLPISDETLQRCVSERVDLSGEPVPGDMLYAVTDGVAIIPVHGVVGQRLSMLERICGGVDVLDIRQGVDAALADPEVKEIVLDISSPGGSVGGVPELADYLRKAGEQKQIASYTLDLAASAAYWIAASTYPIVAARAADVGSIGVYVALLDESRAYAMQGYAVELIKAGRLKGEGYPGLPISAEFKERLKADVDKVYGWFTSHVASMRNRVSIEAMQGQTFMGDDALAAGLVDRVAPSIADLIDDFKKARDDSAAS